MLNELNELNGYRVAWLQMRSPKAEPERRPKSEPRKKAKGRNMGQGLRKPKIEADFSLRLGAAKDE